MNKKTRVLYLSASPLDQDRMQSDKEFRRIYENLDPEYFQVSSRSRMKASELTGVLAKEKPHVVHFSGHGSPDEIILEGPDEKSRFVNKPAVIEVFESLSKTPRVVFMNACWTADNIAVMSRSVDFIIATRAAVFDSAAIEFAAKFYELLGYGESVKSAFNLARKQFEIDGGTNQVEMYELLVRDGAKDRAMIKSSSKGPGGKKQNPVNVAKKVVNKPIISGPFKGPIVFGNEIGELNTK